jgi:hypothetical protein
MSQDQGDCTTARMEPHELTLVAKVDHDKLLLISRQYANLRANLMIGGVAEETIAVSELLHITYFYSRGVLAETPFAWWSKKDS